MTTSVPPVVRGVLAMAAGVLLASAALLGADLLLAGFPLAGFAAFDLEEARYLVNVFNRAGNPLMAVAFTTVAIAVPLTANNYSLKFLEFFVRDRVIATMLTAVVFANLNTIALAWVLKHGFIPTVALHAQTGVMGLAFCLVLPYLYYVFRFLHPSALLARLREQVEGALAAARRPDRAGLLRTEVAEGIEHLANVAIRGVERGDRDTAVEGLLALEGLLTRYWVTKPELPGDWFCAEPACFRAFSSKAIDELTESRTWVEMKVLAELSHVLVATLGRQHGVMSTAAKVVRRAGTAEAALVDPALRAMVVEHFNTFLRRTLAAKDARGVFIVLDQYRLYAEALCAREPAEAVEVGYYLRYYGRVARELGLSFVVEAVAHDLGDLVAHAFATAAPCRHDLLERLLRYDAEGPPLLGVRKAQAILGAALLARGQVEAAEDVRACLAEAGPAILGRVKDELLAVRREKYWEVNERRMNLDWVPESDRAALADLLDRAIAGL